MRVVRGVFLVVALSAMHHAVAGAQISPSVLQPGEMLLQVEAEGKHLIKPDIMTITAGVVTTGSTAARALDANSRLAVRLIDAVRAQRVEPNDIKTAELSVRPVTDEDRADDQGREPRIIGYVASNKVEIRLRDLPRASAIVDALFNAGANTVEGPQFSLSDPRPAERLARQEAAREAEREAMTYAEAFGMRVSRIVRASERGEFEYDGENEIVVTGSRIRNTPIEPGELETRIRLWVDYALIPK